MRARNSQRCTLKMWVAATGHGELDCRLPTRCFLGVARWFIVRLLLIPILCMPVTLFPFAFGCCSLVEEGVTFTQVTNLKTAGEF